MAVPVISVDQMREWEKATWATGKKETEVICRVGGLLAGYARRWTRPGERVVIVAGKGHNGDDALYSRAGLLDREVDWIRVRDPHSDLQALEQLFDPPPALVIEGLFGIGLDRPLRTGWDTVIERLNRLPVPILSVDLPSGLNARTGEPQGAAVEATLTVTLGAVKEGLLTPQAAPYVGRLELEPDIGLVPCPFSGDVLWTEPGDFEGFPPPRPVTTHKGTYGHLGILAGSLGFHGASVLATRGALQAQPGLVTLHPQPEVYSAAAAQLQAAMVHPWQSGQAMPEAYTGLLLGPGLAASDLPASVREEVQRLWRSAPVPVVVDASALDWIPTGPVEATATRVITPHPGEAGRMIGGSSKEIQADRRGAVRELSSRFGGCDIVLKGWHTLIGQAEGPCWINPSGNPFLAQGGSGDLLGGLIAGLLAQPKCQATPELAIRYAVWEHGRAADRLMAAGEHPTIATLASELGSGERPFLP